MTNDIGDLAISRQIRDLRYEVNPVSRLILVIPVASRDPIKNWTKEARKFLNIAGSLVRSVNFGLSWQAEYLTISSLLCIELDQNLLVLDPPAGVQIDDLLKNFCSHSELIQSLERRISRKYSLRLSHAKC